MASSGNIATWNPLDDDRTTVNFSQGNLETKGNDSDWAGCKATFLLSSGKWYWEAFSFKNAAGDADNNGWAGIGITIPNHIINGPSRTDSEVNLYVDNGYTRGKGGNTDQGTSWSASDIIGVAYDADNGTIQFLKNNSSVVTLTGSNVISAPAFPCALVSGSSTYNHTIANFGQDSTFGGRVTAGGNADGNGNGDFKYAPPSGFLAVCSANLPISADIDPAETDDDYPSKQFNAVTWTGNRTSNSTTNAITGVGFQPDLVWLKFREQAYDWRLVDSSRGVTEALRSNQTTVEQTETNGLFQFDSDGFTVRGDNNYNYNGGAFIGYCWRANGGTTASNGNGSITSTVQANDKAGFSIITWTASGSNGSIGHGLSAKPDFHLIKKRDNSSSGWAAYHKSLGATKYLRLDGNGSASTSSYYYNNTEPDATKIYLGDNGVTNHPSGDNYVCYAWREVEGYSKFGSFEGNSNADGPFIYTGFRPRLVFCKAIDASENWQVRDTARSTFNADSQVRIYWNSSNAEGSASTASPIDFLSNGFKVRGSNSEINTNTIVYGAWGDVPFKYNNTF